jgi:hypothetical protein
MFILFSLRTLLNCKNASRRATWPPLVLGNDAGFRILRAVRRGDKFSARKIGATGGRIDGCWNAEAEAIIAAIGAISGPWQMQGKMDAAPSDLDPWVPVGASGSSHLAPRVFSGPRFVGSLRCALCSVASNVRLPSMRCVGNWNHLAIDARSIRIARGRPRRPAAGGREQGGFSSRRSRGEGSADPAEGRCHPQKHC